MKTKIFTLAAAALLFAACDDDKDVLVVSGSGSATLTTNVTGSIALNVDRADSAAVTFNWSNTNLSVNDGYAIPDITTNVLEFATSDDFGSTHSLTMTTDDSRTFTEAEVNAICLKLGIGDEGSNIFARIVTSYGNNLGKHYSNNVSFFVTPYVLDMSILHCFGKSGEEIGDEFAQLYSANNDRNYAGFFVTSSTWFNWYAFESDNAQFGSNADWKAFSFVEGNKNMWLPGSKGAFYITASVDKGEYTATHLGSMTVTGASGETTTSVDATNGLVKLAFNVAADNTTISIQSTTATYYDINTGADAGTTAEYALVFDDLGNVSYSTAAANAKGIVVSKAGDYTLTLNLYNRQPIYTIEAGTVDEPEVIETLYVSGLDDLIADGWTFDNTLSRQGDTQTYVGMVYAKSEYGFRIYTVNDWGDYYTAGETDGSLTFNGDGNIPMPSDGEGLYLITVDLQNLTYTAVRQDLGDDVYILGLNDKWEFDTPLAKTEDGIYEGQITISTASQWGFNINLFDGNWGIKYGGADGFIKYLGNSFTDDATLTAGTYTLTVNFKTRTYTIK